MKVKLGDVCTIAASKNPIQDDSVWLLNLDMVEQQTGKIIDIVYIDRNELTSSTVAFDEDVVLYSKLRPNLNKVVLPDRKGYATSEMLPLKPNVKICREYLAWFLRSPAFVEYAVGKVAGAKMPRLELPTLGEQKHIAAVFFRIDDLISKREQQLQKLDDLVKARFVEIFGDCRTNPFGWETKALGEVAEVGSSKRVFVEELEESGIPFYRGTEIGALAEGKTVQPELFITPAHYEELIEATGKPQPGDLLMPSICPDGRIWVVDTEEPFYFKDGRVLWVHSIKPEYDPVFLLHTLKDRIMTDYGSIASGTTFAELKIFALKQCQVFDVPIEKQKEFVAFIRQTDKSKLAVQNGLEKLETVKKALMQEYFGKN